MPVYLKISETGRLQRKGLCMGEPDKYHKNFNPSYMLFWDTLRTIHFSDLLHRQTWSVYVFWLFAVMFIKNFCPKPPFGDHDSSPPVWQHTFNQDVYRRQSSTDMESTIPSAVNHQDGIQIAKKKRTLIAGNYHLKILIYLEFQAIKRVWKQI